MRLHSVFGTSLRALRFSVMATCSDVGEENPGLLMDSGFCAEIDLMHLYSLL